MQYAVQTQNNTYTKLNLSTVKWAEWDKTQSRELLGLFICVCSSLCTTIAHNIAQNRPDNFPSCPPDNHHCSDCLFEGRGACSQQKMSRCLGVSFEHLWHNIGQWLNDKQHYSNSAHQRPWLMTSFYQVGIALTQNRWLICVIPLLTRIVKLDLLQYLMIKSWKSINNWWST